MTNKNFNILAYTIVSALLLMCLFFIANTIQIHSEFKKYDKLLQELTESKTETVEKTASADDGNVILGGFAHDTTKF